MKRSGNKKLISFALMCIGCINSYGFDFEVDGFYYNYDSKSNTAVLTNNENMKYSGNIVIPNYVTYKGRQLPIKTIGESAFRGCKNLKSVRIPNTIEKIEKYAFIECGQIDTLIIEDGDNILNLEYDRHGGCFADKNSFTICKHIYFGRGEKEPITGYDIDLLGCETITIGPKVEYLLLACHSVENHLKAIYVMNENPPYLGFGDNSVYLETKVYVPFGTKEKYMTSIAWEDYFEIYEMDINEMWKGDREHNNENISNFVNNICSNMTILCDNGVFNISGANVNTLVNIYNIAGQIVSSTKVTSETTIIGTSLKKGEIGIIKIADKTLKFVVK